MPGLVLYPIRTISRDHDDCDRGETEKNDMGGRLNEIGRKSLGRSNQ